jgi:choline dehydrogenase-like flavoprotein
VLSSRMISASVAGHVFQCRPFWPLPARRIASCGASKAWAFRRCLRLSGPDPSDPVCIEANALSEPDDVKTAIACVELLREIGNSAELRPFVKREVMPGDLTSAELESYLRNAVTTYWHQSGTAKMGRDRMSVVDGHLNVYGIDNLRVVDASIMPRITSANTMAPCVVIRERAAQFTRADHRF